MERGVVLKSAWSTIMRTGNVNHGTQIISLTSLKLSVPAQSVGKGPEYHSDWWFLHEKRQEPHNRGETSMENKQNSDGKGLSASFLSCV